MTSSEKFTSQVTDLILINPFLLDLQLTKWTCIPCYMMLLISSVLTLYIVFKKYRAVFNVYFSVLFYIFCQIQFLVVTTISWITESFETGTSLKDNQIEKRYKIKLVFQTYSIILPGYAVLMITLVRTIFVSRPLSYFDYIRRRYQLLGAGLSIILCGMISSLPGMGALCDIYVNRKYTETPGETKEFLYCTHYGKYCSVYLTLLVVMGNILPVVTILCLYIYIYKVTLTARKAHRTLTKSHSSENEIRSCTRNQVVRKECNDDNKISKERRSVPWSILAILGVFVASSTPWILLEVMKDTVIDLVMRREAGAQIFDVFYALVQFFVGISVFVYLLTTTSLRSASFQLIKKCYNLRNAA